MIMGESRTFICHLSTVIKNNITHKNGYYYIYLSFCVFFLRIVAFLRLRKIFFWFSLLFSFFLCNFADMKIAEAIQHFADYVATERRLSPTTLHYYVGEVENFGRFLASQQIFDLEEVEAREVRAWQMSLIEAGEAPGTVIKQIAALRAWFKYLRKQKYYDRDIMSKITPPKAPKRLPIFFRESEVEQIYGEFPDTFQGEMEKLVLRMLYETGMRRSELAMLTVASVDLSALSIKVLGKRNKERIIPIENELAQNIIRYLALRESVLAEKCAEHPNVEPTNRLLITEKGRPVSDGMVYKIVERYMSPISRAERTSPHVFRHTFATHMLNEGADINAIKELLGHSSLNSTEIYTHVSREHLKETYKHAHPRAIKK